MVKKKNVFFTLKYTSACSNACTAQSCSTDSIFPNSSAGLVKTSCKQCFGDAFVEINAKIMNYHGVFCCSLFFKVMLQFLRLVHKSLSPSCVVEQCRQLKLNQRLLKPTVRSKSLHTLIFFF